MKIVNCMKHAANIRLADGTMNVILPSGNIAVVATTAIPAEEVVTEYGTMKTAGKTVYGELTGLPEPQDGVWYYVGMLVFNAAVAIGRKDVVMGDSGSSAERNEKGFISAITTLIFA